MSLFRGRSVPTRAALIGVLAAGLLASACNAGGSSASSQAPAGTAVGQPTGSGAQAGSAVTLTVATAAVPQFDDIRTLTPEFEKSHPGIKVKYVNLPEDQLRDQLTQSVATGSGTFDVVSIGPYEVPIWAKNGWLKSVDPQLKSDTDWAPGDIIPAVEAGLKYKDATYAVPISGESSMLMYRKDLFSKAGITMPAHPSWDDVVSIAAKIQNKSTNLAGMCMRGGNSWGASLAALNPIITTYGGVWYDSSWQPQWSSPATKAALATYLKLQKEYGIPGAASAGFPECLSAFTQGQAAMWFDATSAGSSVEDPKTSKVVGKVGYAAAPIQKFDSSGWLWSWNLAMTSTTKNSAAAWQYMRWASSKEYVTLAGTKLGWTHAPAATRESTYKIKSYLDASPFAQVSLASIAKADPTKHAVPTPYTGSLFLILPSYQDFGTQISQHVSNAITGAESVDEVSSAADGILAKYAEENRKWVSGS